MTLFLYYPISKSNRNSGLKIPIELHGSRAHYYETEKLGGNPVGETPHNFVYIFIDRAFLF
jgi:hypothetical protein